MSYKKKKIKENILRFMECVGSSPDTIKNVMAFTDGLIKADERGLTKFELSFKIGDNTITEEIRLLNLDNEAYSYKNRLEYLKRLKKYFDIMKQNIINPSGTKDVVEFLRATSIVPMDMYFGSDIKDNSYAYAFWIILGGLLPDEKVNFVKFPGIVFDLFQRNIGHAPVDISSLKDVINLGFDITDDGCFYKIYYLLDKEKKNKQNSIFFNKIKEIKNDLGSDLRYCFFASERNSMVNGESSRKKLYLEFLTKPNTSSTKTRELLKLILRWGNCRFDHQRISDIVKAIEGRLVIVAFEDGGTVTFYIRL